MENDTSSEWEQIPSPLIIEEDSYRESTVFPPRDHQSLPIITTPDENNQQFQEPEPNNSVTSSSANEDGARSWTRMLLKLDLRSGIFRIARRVEKYATCYKVFAILASGGVGAVLLFYLLPAKFVMWWQRRMKLEKTSMGNDLMLIINQKDKRINELLLQVAQMNEVLLARRRVQVIRVN